MALTAVGCVKTIECDVNNPCSQGFCFRGFCHNNCNSEVPNCGLEGCPRLDECTDTALVCRPCDDNCGFTDENSDIFNDPKKNLSCASCLCEPRCNSGELCVDGACMVAQPDSTGLKACVSHDVDLNPLVNEAICFLWNDEDPCPESCGDPDGDGVCCGPDKTNVCIAGECTTVERPELDPSMVCVKEICVDNLNVRICRGLLLPL